LIVLIFLSAIALCVWALRFYPLSNKEINFYKGVTLSMNASESDLGQAKELAANIINFVVNIHPQQEGGWQFEGYQLGGKKTWQEHLAPKIKSAHQKGLNVAVSLFISFNDEIKDPEEWLNRSRPLYEELGKFASKNNISLIFVPGEIEVVTGATCCSHNPKADLVPTANNELSAKGFVYWSKKIAHDLEDELRKNFQGLIAAEYIAGNWWYKDGKLTGTPIWDMSGFYALKGGVALDEPRFDRSPAEVSYEYAKEIREIAQKSGVSKVLFAGPLANNLERIRGQEFHFDEQKRRAHYEIFFNQTEKLVDGYFIAKFPPPLYDPVLFAVAREWFKKL